MYSFLEHNPIISKKFKFIGEKKLIEKEYSKADGIILPSIYEGLPFVICEAMMNGCPVIASDTSSIPEVLGDAGMYFDPYSIESITNAFNTVAFDSDLKSEMINKGFLRSKDFSWEKCALKTIQLYKNIL